MGVLSSSKSSTVGGEKGSTDSARDHRGDKTKILSANRSFVTH